LRTAGLVNLPGGGEAGRDATIVAESFSDGLARRIPKWLSRIAADESIVTLMTEARAGSNAKAKCDFSWRPAHPS
jgi:hypothetical protein